MSPRSQDCPTPELRKGYWLWRADTARAEALFVGRGPQADRTEVLRAASEDGPERVAWLKQIHSERSVSATAGYCGEGDALTTTEQELALSVATADCVPVVVASKTRLAVIHAGWRGIASEIVIKTVAEQGLQHGPWTAWVGPAIGPCCYEVGLDVAHEIARASSSRVVHDRRSKQPTVDLPMAVKIQLSEIGIRVIHSFDCCTCCNNDWLWSYRLEGESAGRNFTFAWLKGE
jgi:YfiH family protein